MAFGELPEMIRCQVFSLHKEIDTLHKKHGDLNFRPLYGTGCIRKPELMFVFMNPTAKNISSNPSWRGLRAPWIGTKSIWQLFQALGIISKMSFQRTQEIKSEEWNISFSEDIYREIVRNKVYITPLAKCTQADARALPDKVFKEYLNVLYAEILAISPKRIVTFGDQVSSVVLGKPVRSGSYFKKEKETLKIGKRKFDVYPAYYPIGRGRRNMKSAIQRIRAIL